MTDIIRIGLDTSKSLFQLHGVDAAEQPVLRKRVRRAEMINTYDPIGVGVLADHCAVRV